jgi:D-alanyl-D-alanine carboxypeptidase/D-alanyl-D-alanine-endopeptidase (penicillin-binding protein 4)
LWIFATMEHDFNIGRMAGFLLVILTVCSCASSKYRIQKTPLAHYLRGGPVFQESHSGLVVYDPGKKEVLFDYNGHKHFIPASNTKLLSYFAAINLLDDSIPSLKYAIARDSLFFTGTGDPTMLYGNFDYSATYQFLKDSPYRLVYFESPMKDERFGPGWSWDDYHYYFSPEKSSFPIYGNMMHVSKDSTDDFISIVPGRFEDSLSALHDASSTQPLLLRDERRNHFTLTYGKRPAFTKTIPFVYSADLFVEVLSDTLKRKVTRSQKWPKGPYQYLLAVPTDSICKRILIQSDNFLAEQLLLLISGSLSDTLSSTASIAHTTEAYLQDLKNDLEWVDGSGLSRYNQATPHAMVQLLTRIYEQVPQEKLYMMMPAPGKTGTLKRSFAGLAGHLHAKTGSMTHVYNLSGYLETKSGKTLIFSFLNNNFDVSFSELKAEMERVLMTFVNDQR